MAQHETRLPVIKKDFKMMRTATEHDLESIRTLIKSVLGYPPVIASGDSSGAFSLHPTDAFLLQIAVDYLESKTSQKRLHKLIQALHPYILLCLFNLLWRKLVYHLQLQLFS